MGKLDAETRMACAHEIANMRVRPALQSIQKRAKCIVLSPFYYCFTIVKGNIIKPKHPAFSLTVIGSIYREW